MLPEIEKLRECAWILEELKTEPRTLSSWDWESVDKVLGLIDDTIDYLQNIEEN